MSNYITLNKKKNVKKILTLIKNSNFQKILENKRTTVWENDDLKISIDKSIIRILIYSRSDVEYYTNLFTKENFNEKIISGKIN